MATEHEPQMPDPRSLRLAHTKAIAATDAAKALADKPGVRFIDRMERRARYQQSREAEITAGRAYMAHLQMIEPACVICGCTQMDGCSEDEGGPCYWVSTDPSICSSHAVAETAV